MRSALLAAERPGAPRLRASSIILACSDPMTPRIVAALQVLRELADTTVASGDEARRLIARADVDLVVAEEWVGTTDGRSLLASAARGRAAPVGVLLASSAAGATAAGQDGLFVLPKLVDVETLKTVCTLALERAALGRRLRTFERAHGNHHTAPARHRSESREADGLERYEGLLYRSRAMRAVVQTLRELENSSVTVLIQGETGTGKEVVARAIHARSDRRHAPFLPVNLGTICDSLRESELFGHVRGAFSGASATRSGLFLAADHGCLFLDELGEASAGLQAALLRVLEEGTITPVGADRPRPVEVRIISATNQNLAQLVRESRFRRDLFYRLNVFVVRLPPLRERVEEIVPLAQHFLRRAARDLGREPARMPERTRLALETHPWEGNVRELRSVMERAVLVCKDGLVDVADLSFGDDGGELRHTVRPPSMATTLREHERQLLLRTLAAAEGNQSRAARILGLHESTLRFRLRRAGITTAKRAAAS